MCLFIVVMDGADAPVNYGSQQRNHRDWSEISPLTDQRKKEFPQQVNLPENGRF